VLQYIQPDGTLGDNPVYQTPDEWGTISFYGSEIAPNSIYEVVALCGVYESDPAVITSAVWGDVGGPMEGGAWTPPDGEVNIVDLAIIADAFSNTPTAPPLEWSDIAPCVPDQWIDILDMTWVVDAFKSLPYPCGDPCP
jgi:hypothetical protein